MGENRVWKDYKKWLLRRVYFKEKNYNCLIDALHETAFFFSLDMDENRAMDGLALRDEYFDYIDLKQGIFYQDCTVLEVLIALSLRMDQEYIGDPGDPRPDKIFWELIQNLNLDQYDDKNFTARTYSQVYDILDDWMNRKFDRNGERSIFPLRKSRIDQRKIEIWAQMQQYINENYRVF